MPSQEFIAKMKEKLLEEKKNLNERLSGFAKKKAKDDYDTEMPEYGDKEDENAGEVATYSDNLSLEHNLEKSLRDVSKALDSIAKGTYGICKYCGKEIGEKRLEARPVSTACVECKEKLTKGK
ncbi:MAG: TraR/DksA C4-type zinc finger protein [Patescibacteria group bacterium]|nr:TraR/DksA C4-type zinc finger protein [Patescibacteria group bacterium]MDD5490812.1 TraR/DksA C4-type zinc finger protein [Patescibacteria group bacterium]